MLPISYRHLVAALLCGLALRLYFIVHFPFYSGDTKFYEELARNWLDHGVYGLFVNGQLMPVDQRMPGYPAFLAAIYSVFGRARIAVMLAQAAIDLFTCILAALIASTNCASGEKIARYNNCAVAGRAVSVHRELHSSDRHRNSRDILHHACSADARLDFHRARARRPGRACDRSAGCLA